MINDILKGIDKTETESPDGWWETSAGAEFGAAKLKEVLIVCHNEKNTFQRYDSFGKDRMIEELKSVLSRLTAALKDNERAEKVVAKGFGIWTRREAITDYRAEILKEVGI